MTLPTCAVTAVVQSGGALAAGARVSARLSRYEVHDGYVVPQLVRGVTGGDGRCTLALWPNAAGATASWYDVTIEPPAGPALTVRAVVPNAASVLLHEIAELPVYPGKPDGVAAAQAAAADADAAAGSADAAEASAATAATNAGQAANSATSAALSKTAAEAAAAASLLHVQASAQHALEAQGYADVARTGLGEIYTDAPEYDSYRLLGGDTAAIQSAMNDAAAAGVGVRVAERDHTITALTWPAGLKSLRGRSYRTTRFIRPANDTSIRQMLTVLTKSGFEISGICFDGNRTQQTMASHGLVLNGCSDYTIKDCKFTGQKMVAGYGDGLMLYAGPSENPAGLTQLITDCVGVGNDGGGLTILRTGAGITVQGGTYSGNGASGISYYDQGIAPVDDTASQLTITGARIERNGTNGISVLGFMSAGIGGVRTFGQNHPVHNLIITDNQVNFNAGYGIIFQAKDALVADNSVRGNGSTTHAGICANAYWAIIKGNLVVKNKLWGIDAGGLWKGEIVNNNVRENYVDETTGCGINVGGAIDVLVAGNRVENNAAHGISLLLNDGGGAIPFPWDSARVFIRNNHIHSTMAAEVGISGAQIPDQVFIEDNTFTGFDTPSGFRCIQVCMADGRISGNRYLERTIFLGTPNAFMILPEWVDDLMLQGSSTPIQSIQYFSEQYFSGKLAQVKLVNKGSGYTSAPTVTISGGGGTGATAEALVTQDGRVGWIKVTNPGTGFSTHPTVTISGGGGSGATAAATVGSASHRNRQLRIMSTVDVVNFVKTNRMQLACPDGGSVRLNPKSTITFFGRNGEFYEVARMDGQGVVQAGSLSLSDGITAPGTLSGQAFLYVDSSTGDLTAKFGDGFTRVVGADS